MRKLLFAFIMMLINIFCFCNIFAVTKSDIIGFVNSQSVCGDKALFNSYKSTFTRLLKQKKLTSSELETIYSYLQSSVGILNSKGVCKVSDVSKLTEKEKKSVLGSLYAGAGIITNAPTLNFDEREEEYSSSKSDNSEVNNTKNEENKRSNKVGTNVVLNSETGTMDIYENGVLIDKVSTKTTKMTYTGYNITYSIIIVICIVVFAISLYLFIKLYNVHKGKTRFVKNILVSLMICTITLAIFLILFSNKLDELKSLTSLISINRSNDKYTIKLNEDKTINTYPSYGLNYGKLKIEDLDIDKNIYFGDATDILNIGIGQSTWSDMPTEGGVTVLSSHYNKNMLYNIKDIRVGEEIILDLSYARCKYIVVKTDIINDTDIDKLAKQKNKETIILYTCYPFDSYVYTSKRFIVYATLESINWK